MWVSQRSGQPPAAPEVAQHPFSSPLEPLALSSSGCAHFFEQSQLHKGVSTLFAAVSVGLEADLHKMHHLISLALWLLVEFGQ